MEQNYAQRSTSSFAPKVGVTYTDTKGFTLARGGFDSVNHTATATTFQTLSSDKLPFCNNAAGFTPGAAIPSLPARSGGAPASNAGTGGSTYGQMEHVVRQNKTLNSNPSGFNAPYSTYSQVWPVIQLYDFSAIPSAVTVDYQKNGGDQIVNLTFDRIPEKIIRPVTARADYPQGAQVQADLIDPQLNIDPTEEDSWTWGTSTTNNTLFYQAFSRNGDPDADGTLGMQDISGNLTTLMFNHNGKLTTIPRPQGVQVAESQSNGIQKVFKDTSGKYRTLSISGTSGPITLLEIQPNVGIFGDYDASGKADLKILDKAPRDKSFMAKYNDISYSVVVKFHTATLTMDLPDKNTQSVSDTNPPPVKQTILNKSSIWPIFTSFLKLDIIKNLFFH